MLLHVKSGDTDLAMHPRLKRPAARGFRCSRAAPSARYNALAAYGLNITLN